MVPLPPRIARLWSAVGRFLLPRSRRIWTAAITAVLTLYAVFGFFVLPGIVRKQMIAAAATTIGLTLRVGEVSTNPFTLSLTVRDLLLPDRNGETLFSFDTLYVNFQLSSLFRGAYTFAAIRVSAPYVRSIVRADGSVNLEDLLPADSARPATAAADTVASEPPLPVIVDHLAIARGQIVFEDRQRPTPFEARLDPLNLTLQDFTTRPNLDGDYQLEASTDKGERLSWRGTVSVVPLRSAGHLALSGFEVRTFWSYLQDRVAYEVIRGTAAFEADYEMDPDADPRVFTIRNGTATVDSVVIRDRRDSSEAVTIPSLSVGGLEMRLLDRALRVGSIETRGGRVSGTVGTDSTLSLSTLFLLEPDSAAPVDTGPALKLLLDRLTVADYEILIEDRTTRPAARLALAPLSLTVENYRQGIPGDTKLDLRFAVNGGGAVTVAGTYTPEPMAVALDLNVAAVPLVGFQPYVNSQARLLLRSGTVSLGGRMTYAGAGRLPVTTFLGDVWVEGLRAVDPALEEDFTRWARLDVKRIHYRSEPASLSIDEITAREAYLRVIIGPDRISNLQTIMAAAGDTLVPWVAVAPDDSAAAAAPAAPPPPPARDSAAPVTPTRIGQVRVINSAMRFSDLSLTPNFDVGIEQLEGTISGLSSDQLARADVELRGQVDRYAPVTITGQINPLSEDAYTDITLKFEGIELTTFTPYSGKFGGYRIDRGKLTLDLHYVLSQRILIGENRIVLDQLTLGEKVESPDATSLPVRLAVALLKDSDGVIDLDVPVEGSLDDPKFSVFPIVMKALKGIVVKVVTAPFKLLGGLLGGGGGEDLEYVSFAAGADSLDAVQGAKLDSLAKALTQRPELRLDVRGAAAPQADGAPLARRAILTQLRPGAAISDTTTLTARDDARLRALYQAQFQADPAALVPETDSAGRRLPRAERDVAIRAAALQRLIESHPVSPEVLRTLAQARAAAIKERLVSGNAIDAPRVFLQDVDVGGTAENGQVRIQLALDAR